MRARGSSSSQPSRSSIVRLVGPAARSRVTVGSARAERADTCKRPQSPKHPRVTSTSSRGLFRRFLFLGSQFEDLPVKPRHPMGFPHRFDNPMALPHAGVSRLQCGKKGKKSRKIRRLDIYNHLPADLYSAQYRIVPGHVESGKIKIESRKNLELFLSYGGTIVQHGRYHQHLNTLFGPSRIFRGVIPKPAAGL